MDCKALFIWSRVPETTLPLETTLRSVYMELWVVTDVPSSTLVSIETAGQVYFIYFILFALSQSYI